MTTAVFDCVVFVQAAISSKGPAFACLSLVEEGKVELFASPPIFEEVRDTLTRPKLTTRFQHLTSERVDLFLQKLGRLATLIQDVPAVYSLPRDRDDEPYLNLALNSKVAYLVTRDKDLLDLAADQDLVRRFPETAIVDPVKFLEAVRADENGS